MELTDAQIRFEDHLTNWVYCSNDIEKGIVKRAKQKAIKFAYIQPNNIYKKYLVFDIDRKQSSLDWYDFDCPEPTLVTRNPVSSHCQYIYELERPVEFFPSSRKEPKQYYEAIKAGLNAKLGGDPGYRGFMMRNPMQSSLVRFSKKEPVYSLPELADWVNLDARVVEDGRGRNCTLFESLRLHAYRLSKRSPNRDELQRELLQLAHQINSSFCVCLSEGEVHSICKSVASWVIAKYTGSGLRRGIMNLPSHLRLEDKQKMSGRFAANLQREQSLSALKSAILKHLDENPMDVFCLKQNAMAKKAGLSEDTVQRLVKCFEG